MQLGSDGKYTTMTEYTCKESAGLVTTELRFSSRTGSLSDATLQSMKAVAVKQGVSQSLVDSVVTVNHSKCKDSAAESFLQ